MSTLNNHEFWMEKALLLAKKAEKLGEVPVGAIIVSPRGELIASGFNKKETIPSPLGHAEIIAIHSAASKLGAWRLLDCTLYVTLEPCVMCSGALIQARLKKLVYGTPDPKGGGIHSLYQIGSDIRLNHQLEITEGIKKEECSQLLKDFFKKRRLDNKKNSNSL